MGAQERSSRANDSKGNAVTNVSPLVGKYEMVRSLNMHTFRMIILMKFSHFTKSNYTFTAFNKVQLSSK